MKRSNFSMEIEKEEQNVICPYGTNCYIGNKCYCMNCVIPLENWIEFANSVYNNTNDYNNIITNVKLYDEKKNDTLIFNKCFVPNKNINLSFFINNIENMKMTSLKYNVIYKNNEIIIYTINDKNCFLTNILVYIDNDIKNILKINVISDIRSDFVKSNIINQLIY